MLSQRLVSLGRHEHDGSTRAAIRARLDNLLPAQAIATWDWMVQKRKFVGPTGEEVRAKPSLTPYMKGPTDACDMPEVRVVAVKGNTRCGKTVAAENKVLRHWDMGPLYNVLWFMQDEDSINDYIDERGEAMLKIHTEIDAKIDWGDRRNSRKRKQIGRALLLYRPATMRSTRSKAAPIIVADEIDAYQKKVRDAIMGLVQNRQREFGNSALAYLASHPDAGPDGGIDSIIAESLQHLWWACCPHCGKAASPALEAHTRFNWNVPQLLAQHASEARQTLFDILLNETRILCPHEGCGATFDNDERLTLFNNGTWLQPHQSLDQGVIEGDPRVADVMGFVIHGFMAPFVNVPKTGRDWGAAKIAADLTGNDINLRERTVKDLGETYLGTKEEEKTEDWSVIQRRLEDSYPMKVVPRGVDFLTAFVDVQGDRFEVRVIGWSRALESWLIDAYAIKQWPRAGEHGAFDNIDPSNKLGDWEIIYEAVLRSSYPMQENPDLVLGIAKTAVNASGEPGVTNIARIWLSNLIAVGKIQSWQCQLFQGSPKKTGELYGKPRQVELDDAGKKLATPIYERSPVVHDIKKIIIRRMKIEEPGPGRMHIPHKLPRRFVREMVSETLVNDEWIKRGPNETWDGYVACECARAWLKTDRPGLWDTRPSWATPVPRDEFVSAGDTDTRNPVSLFNRLAEVNRDV